MKILLTVLVLTITTSSAHAGRLDWILNSFRRLSGPTKVTQFENGSAYVNGVLVKTATSNLVDSKTILQKFNDGLIRTTLTSRNKLARPDYLYKQAVAEQTDIISAVLPDKSIVKLHIVSVANSNTKTINTTLVLITNSKSNSLLNDIDDLFSAQKSQRFVDRGTDSLKTISVDVTKLDDMNQALLKLSSRINQEALISPSAKTYLSRKAQSAYEKASRSSR